MARRKRGSADPAAGAGHGRKHEPTGPWKIRYAEEILTEDLKDVGHAALQAARKAIDKKLKVDPEKYGERLHSPLHGLFKLKVSHVRVVYHVEAAVHEVWVLMIGNRRDIWDEDQEAILDRQADLRVGPGEEGGRG